MHATIERYSNLIERILPGKASFSPFMSYDDKLDVARRVDGVGQIFMQGCREALKADTLDGLAACLNAVEVEVRGFAFEGAGMGLALFDHLAHEETNRLQCFADGSGAAYASLLYIGAGWTVARLHQPVDEILAGLHPVLGWLVLDGYGFHEGFFSPSYRNEQATPKRVPEKARAIFDQGLGRSFWFTYAGDQAQIADTIAAFPAERRGDLWSGIGLACAYTGIIGRAALQQLHQHAGEYASYVAQGMAIATMIRHRSGNVAPHTELACQVFCSASAEEVAAITDQEYAQLSQTSTEHPYATWQQLIRRHFA
ncbi:DUF1702 family protein [Dictyobacter formicarum]|uniref:DUF1702 family protein n=1 Tax=Dictyobacter formicarum TaxID=2778368 RepID=A0ABQ3VUM5_9CHLR|nr:DUF1702 family protein [Dictyobacter formicarum]GHO89518.1 hypothetical protein KSZ_75240 [Dictyobacter formicarum]